MAASLRRNISFPAPRPSHPGARKRRQRITNQPSISSPTTAAAVIPRSSTAFGSQRSSEKHPSPQPLPRQIPIDDQALIALPRVRSSGAFRRRSPYTGSNARVGPASETLNDTGPSSGADQLAEAFDPSQPFAVAGALPNRTQNRSGRALSPNPSISRCEVCVVWEAVPRCDKQSFSPNTIRDRNRWLHHCAPPAVSNRFGSLVHIGTRPDQQAKRKQASDHSQVAG